MRVLLEAHAATASHHHAMATYGIIFSLILICLIEEHVVAALPTVVHILLSLVYLLLLVVIECAHVPVAVLCHQAVIVYRWTIRKVF